MTIKLRSRKLINDEEPVIDDASSTDDRSDEIYEMDKVYEMDDIYKNNGFFTESVSVDKENENQIDNEKELQKYSKSQYFETSYNIFMGAITIIYNTVQFLIKICGIYFLWIILHYFASHLYVKFCVPNTVIGFVMSPFMVTAPHCQGLRWIVFNASSVMNNMWIVLGTWIGSFIKIES